MVAFAVLLWFVSRWYLIPALQAFQVASGDQKRQLAAHARLVLAIILFILVAGILLTFRFGRYFAPRLGEKSKPTQYVDAWAESARRVAVPSRDDDDDEEGDDDDADDKA
jgi:hypothetical protein